MVASSSWYLHVKVQQQQYLHLPLVSAPASCAGVRFLLGPILDGLLVLGQLQLPYQDYLQLPSLLHSLTAGTVPVT